MLQIKNIAKKYVTGDFVQAALDDVSLSFRRNEFVAILGPSGSGKTTMLNIIGGLDRYDSGDLIINSVSTKEYSERDWDTYRNHSIGFVFQSYNLIAHQSVLSNVELALKISGISSAERKDRAKQALAEVGLIDHINKRPNQLSGGQMQRVAIARALINDPDILLADEPTGAIDSETSLQIMELLKKVAEDRLVIMVTHNPELAEKYATRTILLKDGKVVGDTDPVPMEAREEVSSSSGAPRAAMNYLTALSLSFSNLMTKKGRTILTAFAGSIGIIGIALILALSNGVSSYITDIQRETMISYPISIDARTFDISSFMTGEPPMAMEDELDHELDAVYSDSRNLEMASVFTSTLTENNLTAFKKYLDDPNNEILPHLGDSGVQYSYDPAFSIYTYNLDDELQDASGEAFQNDDSGSGVQRELGRSMRESFQQMPNPPGTSASASVLFQELLPGEGDEIVSQVIHDNYEIIQGDWPKNYNEVLLVLNEHNEIPIDALDALGFLPAGDYAEAMEALDRGDDLPEMDYRFDYNEAMAKTLYLVPAGHHYAETEDGTFRLLDETTEEEDFMDLAMELTISGIIRPQDDADIRDITGVIVYPAELTHRVIDETMESPVVKAQLADASTNVLSGLSFNPPSTEVKIEEVIDYIQGLDISEKADMMMVIAFEGGEFPGLTGMPQGVPGEMPGDMPGDVPDEMPDDMPGGMPSEVELAAMVDAFLEDPDEEILLEIYEEYVSPGTYEDNLSAFGYVDREAPSSIRLYADSFESKDAIAEAITAYNQDVAEEDRIVYTDLVALMTSSITDIIDVITYVLIAFVAVSLVVSSIMIGIITFISVVERTKEIGILRALGASRRNIAQVFNAETFVIGLFAGILGVGISYLLTFPINNLIHNLTGNTMVNAWLSPISALVLIALSVLLTMIGGLIPSRTAARKDPVAALRTE